MPFPCEIGGQRDLTRNAQQGVCLAWWSGTDEQPEEITVDTNLYIHTSVDDARTSLECQMARDPLYVVLASSATLVELKGRSGQKSRRQMLAGMIRKAIKEVPMEVVNDQ